VVSKAFQVLSDPQKRAIYDRSGGDPESRFGGGPSDGSGSTAFARSPSGGMAFEGEISPEDLFNMFFGGGMGGAEFGGFGGPGVFTASFGPGGFRTTRVGGGVPRQARAGGDTNSRSSMLIQLFPLLIFLAFSILQTLPSLFASPSYPDPRFSFQPSMRFDTQRTTPGMGVKYHVNMAELRSHPVLGAEIARAASQDNVQSHVRGTAMEAFENNVEHAYTRELYTRCQRSMDHKERRKEREIGFMGIGTDWEKVKRIEAEKIEECEELRRHGIIR
jgi:DnaJ homolog subfamily B member 12